MSDNMRIGVVGAGTMGNGIAQAFAMAAHPVVMVDVDQKFLDRGLATVKKSLSKLAEKGRMTPQDAEQVLGRISVSLRLEDCGNCGLVVEAASEDVGVKKALFARLDKACRPDAILATNTSTISVTEIAAATGRPDKVVGMHFMNPVPLMKLVEVVKGLATAPETVQTIVALAEKLGKAPVVVNDSPGFVSNRVLLPMINEAVFALEEGVAGAEAIDTVMKLGMNHPMGPLALADLIGLDVCLNIMEVLHAGFSDSKYRPCPLLRQLVAAGRLGRKTGRGFYEYPAG